MKSLHYPCLVLAVAGALAASGAMAQAVPDPAIATPKKEVARKDAPKKAAAPKKVDTAKKDGAPGKTAVSKNVTIYKNTPPPPLKGKDGKDIPVTPDAYDVSSAVPKIK